MSSHSISSSFVYNHESGHEMFSRSKMKAEGFGISYGYSRYKTSVNWFFEIFEGLKICPKTRYFSDWSSSHLTSSSLAQPRLLPVGHVIFSLHLIFFSFHLIFFSLNLILVSLNFIFFPLNLVFFLLNLIFFQFSIKFDDFLNWLKNMSKTYHNWRDKVQDRRFPVS